MSTDADVVVIGSGIAGLSVALGLAATRKVVLVTSTTLGGGSTRWAQGGLAAAIDVDDDPRWHADDTKAAGAGLCVPDVVDRLVEEGPLRLAELVSVGAALDRDADGRLALSREGGHSRRRVVHAGGDATGAEVSRALTAALRRTNVEVIEHAEVEQVLLAAGPATVTAAGVRIRRGGSTGEVTARAVVLATGGIGGLYACTTNPAEVTGEGIGLALRAGAEITDLEFVQFHPTALRVPGARHQLPLVTEALRGDGAVLVDASGRRVMAAQHPLADLAPRDVVARRLHQVMTGADGTSPSDVFLDATSLGDERWEHGYPTVRASCARLGIDPTVDPIPVMPAQHFSCGGVRTDRFGATTVPGLYAVGEVAATGVHGANRLASNSLVEGLVFGGRVAARLVLDLPEPGRGGHIESMPAPALDADVAATIATVMSGAAGIVRTGAGLADGQQQLECLTRRSDVTATTDSVGNRWVAARALLFAARQRQESRGCHWRDDFPATSAAWQRHLDIRLNDDGVPTVALPGRRLRSA